MADVLVLCYHAVSERWPANLSVTPRALEAQLQHLLARGYRGATFRDALSVPFPRTVAVTFDDGYRSVVELAFPLLSRLGVPGTVFLPTDWIGRETPMAWPGVDGWLGGEHEDELVPMSWSEARTLVARGWEVGSHTMTHPRLTQLDDVRLAAELKGSRERCEAELGTTCASIAYPYGDVDSRVAAAARRAGYEAGAVLPSRLAGSSLLEWPRVGIYHTDTRRTFLTKTSPIARRLRSSAAWPVVSRARLAARRIVSR